jgi:hypothetical protein
MNKSFKKQLFFLIVLFIVVEYLWSISYYNIMFNDIIHGTKVPMNVWIVLFGTGAFMFFGGHLLKKLL